MASEPLRRYFGASPYTRVARRLGAAVRHTVSAVSYPYRALVGSRGNRAEAPQTSTGGWSILAGWGQKRKPPYDRRSYPKARFDAAQEASAQGLTSLAKTLADPDPNVRALAIEVICGFSEDRAEPLLIGVLHDPDPGVRRVAALAAARMHVSGTVLALIFAVDDPDEEVRLAAAQAVEQITGKPIRFETDDPLERQSKLEELKKWWKQQRFSELDRAVRNEMAQS